MSETRSQPSIDFHASDPDARSSHVMKAILTLLETLSPEDRERVQRVLASRSATAPKKPSEVMGVVLKLIPKSGNWSVDEIKKKMMSVAIEAKPKDIYNAVNYLTRKGCIRRISYGRYVTAEGFYFESSDIVDAEPPVREGDADD